MKTAIYCSLQRPDPLFPLEIPPALLSALRHPPHSLSDLFAIYVDDSPDTFSIDAPAFQRMLRDFSAGYFESVFFCLSTPQTDLA